MTGLDRPDRELVDALGAVFGGRMRQRREQLGHSQQYVATALQQEFGINWHQTTVGKVEAGERPIRLTEALAVCMVLELDTRLDLLMYGAPDEAREAIAQRRALVELLKVREFVDERAAYLQRELNPSAFGGQEAESDG